MVRVAGMTAWPFHAMLLGAAIALLMCVAVSAQPQPMCDTPRALLDWLAREFQEYPMWEGTFPGGKLIITRNDKGGWSEVRVQGQRACITLAGPANRFDKGT